MADISKIKVNNTTYDLKDAGAARTSHVHAASDITSGTIDAARLPVMGGATVNEDGTAGLVPAPSAMQNFNFLRGDGTWNPAVTAMTNTQIDAICV